MAKKNKKSQDKPDDRIDDAGSDAAIANEIEGTEETTDGPLADGDQLPGAVDGAGEPLAPPATEPDSAPSAKLAKAQAEYDDLVSQCKGYNKETTQKLREYDAGRKTLVESRKQGLTQLLAQKLEASKRLDAAKAEAGVPAAG